MSKKPAPAPEFSHIVDIDHLNKPISLTPNEAERAAIAKRLQVEKLHSFSATVTLSRIRAGEVLRIAGHIKAELEQACIVTLEPVPESIDEEFELLMSESVTEESLDPDSEDFLDMPEPLTEKSLDIGEIAVQYLALALNPYPRKPGVEFAGYEG